MTKNIHGDSCLQEVIKLALLRLNSTINHNISTVRKMDKNLQSVKFHPTFSHNECVINEFLQIVFFYLEIQHFSFDKGNFFILNGFLCTSSHTASF